MTTATRDDSWVVRTYGGTHDDVLVLVGPSANEEITVRAVIAPEYEGRYLPGEKNLVRSIRYKSSQAGGYEFAINTAGGQQIVVRCDHLDPIPAGSSVNVAIALRQLGVDDIAVFAPIGVGRGGQFISSSLQEREFRLALFRSPDGTARTLTVRSPSGGRSTLFLEKPSCVAPPEVVRSLTGARPELLVATGVKPDDLPLIESMFGQEGVGIARVFTPNRELLARADLAGRVLEMLKDVDLFQLNRIEAGQCLGQEFRFETTAEQIKRLAEKVGARVTGVTLGARGAIFMARGEEPIIQEACSVPMEKLKDDCGSGDAFLTTMIYLLFVRSPPPSLRDCLRAAAWVAAEKVQHDGPWSGIPDRKKFNEKLAELGIR